MDPLWLIPIDREWVEKREALLITAEDEMFTAARERASTDDERRYWDEFLAIREANLRRRVGKNR